MNIVIIDYGLGNLGSILNMLHYLEIEAVVSSDAVKIKKAKKLILPGVGSFDHGIKNLKATGLMDILNHLVLINEVPILGICLGMQLMTNTSEEGVERGLCWIDADTKKFDFSSELGLKVPHIGWNSIMAKNDNVIMSELADMNKFYFVHSYYVSCNQSDDVIANSMYGHDFTSIFAKKNIYGCQFHPEKSHRYGMQLFKNFHNL